MKMERSVVGKLKDDADLLQVEAPHCQDPEESQSLDSAVHSQIDPLKCKYKDNETFCFHSYRNRATSYMVARFINVEPAVHP